MKKLNCVIAMVLGILVGMIIEQNNTINILESVNESVEICCDNEFCHEYAEEEVCTNDEVHYHEEDYFWCDDCKESYNHYCEGCGKGEELWNKYYNEYVMMNYCEYCDTCYYKYCDCEGATEYIGQDWVEFTIEYDEYLHDYCTNYCEDCDEFYYDHCCGCEDCDDSERYYDDYRAYLMDIAIGNCKYDM